MQTEWVPAVVPSRRRVTANCTKERRKWCEKYSHKVYEQSCKLTGIL